MTQSSLIALVSSILIYAIWRIAQYIGYKSALRRNGCREAPQYAHKDPLLGLDFFFKFMNAFKGGYLLDFNKTNYEKYGTTYTVNSFGTKVIKTIDPKVSQAVNATYFPNFGFQPLRYDIATHFWGNGIIVVDGTLWKHARALMKSSFDVVHLANMERLQKHTNTFMKLLPEDGSTVDLAPLFKRLILDTSSDFIFGEAMGALERSEQYSSFMDAFEYAQRGTGIRAVLGRLKFLHRDKKWWDSCKQVTDCADEYVEQALERLKDSKTENEAQQIKRLRLVDQMARDTQDKVTLRSHIINVFSPAHDGAATTLTNTMFHLARYPNVWRKLKAEIRPTKDQPLTYDLLNSYQYLEWVLKETHRLTPVATITQKLCVKTTVVPFGGGPDGLSPLYIQKGDMVELDYRTMSRDGEFWGEDEGQFKPERWGVIRPGWKYTPFGGGPRVCPGQRLVFTECAYVLVTFLRRFDRIENRDKELKWIEEFRLTVQSKNGCVVGLIKTED